MQRCYLQFFDMLSYGEGIRFSYINFNLWTQNDFEMVDYINELREGCLEAYTGIVQGLKGEEGSTSGEPLPLLHTV